MERKSKQSLKTSNRMSIKISRKRSYTLEIGCFLKNSLLFIVFRLKCFLGKLNGGKNNGRSYQ